MRQPSAPFYFISRKELPFCESTPDVVSWLDSPTFIDRGNINCLSTCRKPCKLSWDRFILSRSFDLYIYRVRVCIGEGLHILFLNGFVFCSSGLARDLFVASKNKDQSEATNVAWNGNENAGKTEIGKRTKEKGSRIWKRGGREGEVVKG